MLTAIATLMLITILGASDRAQIPEPSPVPLEEQQAGSPSPAPEPLVQTTVTQRAPPRSPSLGQGQTKVVCRRERRMDTNIAQRVCREVLVNSSQRERMGTDMVREFQRLTENANE